MCNKRRTFLIIGAILVSSLLLVLLVSSSPVHAASLVDETSNAQHAYSKYPVNNYQLDYFVDSSWDWLPWNWGDGIGKSVSYGIYAITNFLWLVSVYLSYATGYLIQQAYSLDFIKDAADKIGSNMQLLAGVSEHGFSSTGFYPGLMLILILIVGVYVAYTGLIKRETSKAISAVINFVVIFILSAGFIAYSPDYINRINEFSSDISNSALNTGSKMIMTGSPATSEKGVDTIRDTLFSIQVKQPWTLLQFGDSDAKKVGTDRIDKLMKTSPFDDKGKTRTDLVKTEIEDKKNDNLSPIMTINRLGVTVFIVIFDVIITFFVMMLTAMMIFSQVLFIIYATFLPISFLLAMIPSFNGMAKKSIMRLFNVIMTRAGITLILTIAFCISSMIYSLSSTTPFFLVAFLQIVTFGGIWTKLGDLMSMMQLDSSDSQNGANRLARRGHRMIRQLVGGAAMGGMMSRGLRNLRTQQGSEEVKENVSPQPTSGSASTGRVTKKRPLASRAGRKVGDVLDVKNKVADKAKRAKDGARNLPTNFAYGVQRGKDAAKKGVNDFKTGVSDKRDQNIQERELANKHRRDEMERRRLAIHPEGTDKDQKKPTATPTPVSTTSRPATTEQSLRAKKAATASKPLPTTDAVKPDREPTSPVAKPTSKSADTPSKKSKPAPKKAKELKLKPVKRTRHITKPTNGKRDGHDQA